MFSITFTSKIISHVYIMFSIIVEALSAEEKARLEELAEAEKNKALQKKKDAEEKKKKMEELAQQQK